MYSLPFLLSHLGNVLIADESNHRIRKVTVSTGIITTIAGTGTSSYSGDGGAATSAALYNPCGVALDASGAQLYIADSGNNRVRKVTVGGPRYAFSFLSLAAIWYSLIPS